MPMDMRNFYTGCSLQEQVNRLDTKPVGSQSIMYLASLILFLAQGQKYIILSGAKFDFEYKYL